MSSSDFDRMGELLRDHVDAPQSDTDRALLRARVVEKAAVAPRAWRMPLLAAASLSVVAAVVLVVVLHRPTAQPISFQVGDTPTLQQPGTWLAPVGTQPLSLTFSEGSVIVLDPQAKARIARTTPEGASFQLESGKAHFQIVHRADTEWNVLAGPYTVRVRGTSFSASWDASAEVFELTLESGSVIVRGPGIEAGVQLEGVQHFVGRPAASAAPAACAPAATPHASSDPSMLAPPEPAATTPAPHDSAAGRPPAAPSAAIAEQESWAALAAKGQYRGIVEQAEARGADASIGSASQADLWALAEAARLTGKGALARRALLAMRSRFPGSSRAASAAFLLGRMSDDGGGGDAISWYDRYVAEAPSGAFVPEALGRRMVALRRSGNTAEAKQAASAYLQRFPKGPYAGVARDLVEP